MQLHELKPVHRQKRRKRIGRGGKRGTYSGRGIKGQKARAGHRMVPKIRGLLKKYPKLRGYRRGAREKPIAVNLASIEKQFENGEKVTPALLAEKKIAGRIKGRALAIKILGGGEITKALHVEGCAVSQSAKAKIEKPGGTVQ